MTGTEIYKRTPIYDEEAASIRLHAPHWKLLLAYDGQRSLAEVALSVDIPFAEALPLTEQFLEREWIEEQPITLEQYLKRTGASSVSAIGAAVPPPVILHEPKPEATAPAAVLASAVMEETAPAFRAGSPPETGIAPPPLPAGPKGASGKPLKLSALVDFIVSQSGNSSLGQLTVYRVFLRVSPQLLQDEDIVSVHLVSDPTLVKSAPLKQAIADAVQEVLKRPLPDSVFAPA
jgi:hypothetical protein